MINEYFHILSNPAHTLVEATFILVEFIILNVIWRFIKTRWERHMHRDIKAGRHTDEK